MSTIFNAQPLYESIAEILKQESAALTHKTLASVSIGNDYSTSIYTASQAKAAQALGIHYIPMHLSENISQAQAIDEIHSLNTDPSIAGILLNKPFPDHCDESALFSAINPHKDIEGLTPHNLGGLLWGEPEFVSPTVLSVLEILDYSEIELYGTEVTLVGFSTLIGKPLALMLARRFATVTITHIATYEKERLPFYLAQADVVISAVGKPHIIPGEWIKKGAVVIDVGIGHKNGKTCGDIDFESAVKRASLITPVPGGVGKLTTMFLFKNLIKAAKKQTHNP